MVICCMQLEMGTPTTTHEITLLTFHFLLCVPKFLTMLIRRGCECQSLKQLKIAATA